MNIYLFYHSVISDWNHGNAHFLRGLISSLYVRNSKVQVLEPKNGWSLQNLIMEQGLSAYYNFKKYFPFHTPVLYNEKTFNPDEYLHDADLVIVHEWNHPDVIKKIGEYKAFKKKFILFFHDTHHRAVTKPEEMPKYDLQHYDGVLAYGEVIKDIYLRKGWTKNAWTWHEAADHRIFHPVPCTKKEGDLVWIGNWGDDERTEELKEFIIDPVKELGLKASFYGVGYPRSAIKLLKKAKIEYKGWVPNYKVPEIFSKYRVTVHVPRRPYVSTLAGIPTIRPFEALACGIPLVCSPWNDKEHLFTPGKDYLIAQNGNQMKEYLAKVLNDPVFANYLIYNGLYTIGSRHTCDHRVVELMKIIIEVGLKRIENIKRSERIFLWPSLN